MIRKDFVIRSTTNTPYLSAIYVSFQWSYVPGAGEMSVTSNVLSSAIFAWLGFYVPVDLGAVAWERKSWKLFAINTGYHLMMLIVAAVILMSM